MTDAQLHQLWEADLLKKRGDRGFNPTATTPEGDYNQHWLDYEATTAEVRPLLDALRANEELT